jgi:hypothetical protein
MVSPAACSNRTINSHACDPTEQWYLLRVVTEQYNILLRALTEEYNLLLRALTEQDNIHLYYNLYCFCLVHDLPII